MSDAQPEPTPTPPPAPASAAPPPPPPAPPTGPSSAAPPSPPPSQPPGSTDPKETAVREAVDRLRDALPRLKDVDRTLAERVETLVQQADSPVRINQTSFQHRVAYATEDALKVLGTKEVTLSQPTSAEIRQLAASAPQLENPRAMSLLASTQTIADRALVGEIRRAGMEIGLQADQTTPAINTQLDSLENRLRLATRLESPRETASPVQPPQGPRGPDQGPETVRVNDQRRPEQTSQQSQPQTIFVPGGSGNNLQDSMFRAMRGGGSNTPSWEPGAQSFSDRLSAYQSCMNEGRDDMTLRGAERSGRAALEAMQGFREGEGAVVMNRINAAARSDPNGMAGVLSDMKKGGKYADLRQQFNNALTDERGVAAAYDRAAAALASYGKDRTAVEQVIARRPDAGNLTAKFEAMDKEIASAGGELPSRRDGKTMIEDLSRQVAEMLQRAVDTVKNLFSRGPSAGASASGPSPS